MYYEEIGGFSEGSPLRQPSIISRVVGGIFERLEESVGSLLHYRASRSMF